MSNVIPLGDNILPGVVDQDLVDDLELLLEDAKAGRLLAIGYAAVVEGDVTSTGWSGRAGTRHALSSAIITLHARYAQALISGGEN
jgi:hypothetical protein